MAEASSPLRRVSVPDGPAVRADRFLAAALEGFSRRRVQHLLEEGRIRLDGRVLRKGEMLEPGRTFAVELLGAGTPRPLPEPDLEFPVLYEDAWLVAVDKPSGAAAHALRDGDRGTVANFLAARYPESVAASDNPLDAGLVHRLDGETSGVLLAARRREAWRHLRRQFREREVEKRYIALVHGAVEMEGEIRLPIASASRSAKRVRVLERGRSPLEGQAAVTRYRPLERLGDFALLEVEIPTGVRHQIRAHLAAAGHAVVGDPLYGPDPPDARAPRLCLHAASLAFVHPADGRRLELRSPLAADFTSVLAAVSRRRSS